MINVMKRCHDAIHNPTTYANTFRKAKNAHMHAHKQSIYRGSDIESIAPRTLKMFV